MKQKAFYRPALAAMIGVLLSDAAGAASIFDADEVVDLYQAGAQVRFQGFDVTSLPGGRFAATWVEHNIETDLDQVKLARFDQDGNVMGGILTVSEHSVSSDSGLSGPIVGSDGDGDMVVVWNAGSRMPSSNCREHVMLSRVGSDDSVSDPWLASMGYGFSCNADLAVNQDGWFVVGMSYYTDPGYIVQVYGPEGYGRSPPFLLRSRADLNIPIAVALQVNSALFVWSEVENDNVAFTVSRYEIDGSGEVEDVARLNAGDNGGIGLYQTLPVLSAGADGGYASAWFQSESVDEKKVFSQRIQYINADGSAGAAATIGEDPLDILSGDIDMASDRDGAFLIGWTVSENGEPRYRKVTAFDEEGVIEPPATIVSKSDLGLYDASDNTRVVLSDDLAVVAWYEQADGNSGPVLKALIGSPPRRSDVGQGSSGGGGSTGPALLFGLALLALRLQLTCKQRLFAKLLN
ncbi:hypothetical protein BN2364_2279 [Alloalcanivorax xenomutans]|uniref:hypothetical protein n=1 Tax=Alloalcanivorax xenomutans TaxID=1094342 RepID=UPI0006D5CA69|nr:hypothetical protein [Alloalcanivorax xenomutans]PHS69797.1 MAG: hypothetical protein COB00_05585 [Alcanivorax sp.]CUR46720.1 hypothetical protein BN2364_2279 [Alloalcanivorax xenomutans]